MFRSIKNLFVTKYWKTVQRKEESFVNWSFLSFHLFFPERIGESLNVKTLRGWLHLTVKWASDVGYNFNRSSLGKKWIKIGSTILICGLQLGRFCLDSECSIWLWTEKKSSEGIGLVLVLAVKKRYIFMTAWKNMRVNLDHG